MKCVICKQGETHSGLTVVTLQRDDRTLVIKGVPAEICENCGEYYLSDEIAKRLYQQAEESYAYHEWAHDPVYFFKAQMRAR